VHQHCIVQSLPDLLTETTHLEVCERNASSFDLGDAEGDWMGERLFVSLLHEVKAVVVEGQGQQESISVGHA
jgi:hypothetical protein